MFRKIMVPVDLAHREGLARALRIAADLAKQHGAELVYVAVSAAAPSGIAHNPAEFRAKLDDFAAGEAAAHGVPARGHAVISHDPATDLDPSLLKAVEETGADLVVMASHVPGLKDHVWPSNGGTVAAHAKVSVLVVRG